MTVRTSTHWARASLPSSHPRKKTHNVWWILTLMHLGRSAFRPGAGHPATSIRGRNTVFSWAPPGVAAEHGNQRDRSGVGLLESVGTSEGAGRHALITSKDSRGTFIGWIIVGIAAVLRLGWLDLAAY